MTRQVFWMFWITASASVALAQQTPKVPAQQARFCSVLGNWKLRNGYAPGKEPKVDPNPIIAARAPKPPDPGNLFDQLVEVMGATGEFVGWQAKVGYVVLQGAINVEAVPVCPENASDVSFSTIPSNRIPLQSPMADFLANFQRGSVASISGHLVYDAGAKFYTMAEYAPGSLRKGNPYSPQSPADYFFSIPRRFAAALTSIGK